MPEINEVVSQKQKTEAAAHSFLTPSADAKSFAPPPLQLKATLNNSSPADSNGTHHSEVSPFMLFSSPSSISQKNEVGQMKEGEGTVIQKHDGHGDHAHPNQAPVTSNPSTGGSASDTEGPAHQPDREIADSESCSDTEQEAKDRYFGQVYGPQDMTPPTGTGGFRASFYPNSRALYLDVYTAVNFHNGLTINPISGVVTVNPTGHGSKDAILQNAMNTANALPNLMAKLLFVSQYTWTDAEITSGMATLSTQMRVVERNWSNQHQFYVDKDCWRSVRANINVKIFEYQGTAANNDHLEIKLAKTPSTQPNLGATVYSYGDVTTRNNEMVLDDDFMGGANPSNLLNWQVNFDYNSDVLSADQQSFLDQFIIGFRDDNTQNRADGNPATNNIDNDVLNEVTLVGRASSEGSDEYNRDLAQRRIDAVKDYLRDNGFDRFTERIETDNQGETGAAADASWRRVDLSVGSGEAQHTLTHEFGHVLGLKDEYATDSGGLISGTGNNAGTVVGHDNLSQNIGAGRATAENNDGIMSLGNEVRGQHYSTFGWALQQLTSINEWKIVS